MDVLAKEFYALYMRRIAKKLGTVMLKMRCRDEMGWWGVCQDSYTGMRGIYVGINPHGLLFQFHAYSFMKTFPIISR